MAEEECDTWSSTESSKEKVQTESGELLAALTEFRSRSNFALVCFLTSTRGTTYFCPLATAGFLRFDPPTVYFRGRKFASLHDFAHPTASACIATQPSFDSAARAGALVVCSVHVHAVLETPDDC